MHLSSASHRCGLAAVLVIGWTHLMAQVPLHVARTGSQAAAAAPAGHFSGQARVEPLFEQAAPSRMEGGSVTFEPGARTDWHTHEFAQILVVMAGTGRVQKWGAPVQQVRSGDVIQVPPRTKHWHGAGPDAPMTHVSVVERPAAGSGTTWLEPVTDEQYDDVPAETARHPAAPLTIQQQGSFAVGGSVVRAAGNYDPIAQGAFSPNGVSPEGQSLHGDHAYVFYQVPERARQMPLVFWHGYGQSGRTWESTPDGREGFQTLFLREGYGVYVIDQPRRGRAARSTVPVEIPAVPDEQLWFGIFRLGAWPDFYDGVQFSKDPQALEQFFRQMVPDTGPYDAKANIAAVSTLVDRLGGAILVTHSHSGGPGWQTAIGNDKVSAVVSFEPGADFPFPEGEAPPAIRLAGRTVTPPSVSKDAFKRLTEIPVVVYYGDNIPDEASTNPGQEQWRVFLEMANRWRDVVNRHGGDVEIVHLPDIGIEGNTHFPMSDLNNRDVAAEVAEWLSKKGLDRR